VDGYAAMDFLMEDNVVLANSGGGLQIMFVSRAEVRNNIIQDNTGGSGVKIVYGDVLLADNSILNNSSDLDYGAGLYVQGDARILSNLFENNHNQSRGGAVYYTNGGPEAVFQGNEIRENRANNFLSAGAGSGGGLHLEYCDEMVFSANLIANNRAVNSTGAAKARGGGVTLFRSDSIFINNFIVDNQSGGAGSGVYAEGSSPTFYHNTIANNTGGDGAGFFALENALFNDPSVLKLYNNVIVSQTVGVKVDAGSALNLASLDGVLWWANTSDTEGNVLVFNPTIGNPNFLDPVGHDYHLKSGSAARGQGTDVGVYSDYDFEPRFSSPDLGADEYWAPGGFWRIFLADVLTNSP